MPAVVDPFLVMSHDDLSFDATTFSGRARLFPLPNLVLFPHVMQPLHIFEPRYRAMLEEALAGDGLIGMAVLAPGWESDYDGRPPLVKTACLCRVATHCKTEDGTYNVLVLGLQRLQIVRELPPKKRFREAEVRLLDDVYPAEHDGRRGDLQRQLVAAFRRAMPKLPAAQEQLEQLLSSQISLGMLTDIVGYTLNVEQKIKEELLAEPLPDLRALLLLKCLGERGETMGRRVFPPEFSEN